MDLFDPATPTGKMLSDMWRDIQIAADERAIREAKADPEKHKMSRLIADNKPAQYFYMTTWEKRTKRGGRTVRWCWSQHPNIAGYYLSWRQVETRRSIKRTQFKAHKHRYLGEIRAQRETAKAAPKAAPKAA